MNREHDVTLPAHVEILVVGAGMAGLTAARALADAGRDVLVVDKGWNPGGRMATRTTDRARFDHGATFFYAGGGGFAASLDGWRRAGTAASWEGLEAGAVHWRGQPDMRTLARHLARGLRVATRTRLIAVGREGPRWMVASEDGAGLLAEAVVLTPPIPQALALLAAGDFRLEEGVAGRLASIPYESVLVAMAELDGPGRVSAPGFAEPRNGPIARVVDERAKGTSTVPAVTLHATPDFSRARWEDDREAVGAEIVRAAEPWLGCGVLACQVHGWRYARPVTTWPAPCLVAADQPKLVLAGDAFGGPDVPGAHRSGMAAAVALGAAT